MRRVQLHNAKRNSRVINPAGMCLILVFHDFCYHEKWKKNNKKNVQVVPPTFTIVPGNVVRIRLP